MTNKLQQLEQKDITKTLCGLFLKQGEKDKLYKLCVKYDININYPNLFLDDVHYYLWGIINNGIGLIGTVIMNYLSENGGTIFHSLDELENYLKNK